MKKLQAELDEAITDCKALPDMNVLQGLPYFSAFMKEGSFPLLGVNLVLFLINISFSRFTGIYSCS